MTAPNVSSEEARNEQAGETVRIRSDHEFDGGLWGFAGGFVGRLQWRAGPEQLLRRRLNSAGQQFELGPDLFFLSIPNHGVRIR